MYTLIWKDKQGNLFTVKNKDLDYLKEKADRLYYDGCDFIIYDHDKKPVY